MHAWVGQNVTEARYGHSKAASAPLILSGAGVCYTKVYMTYILRLGPHRPSKFRPTHALRTDSLAQKPNTYTTYEACTAAIGSTRASLTTFRSCAMRRVASVARATATTRRSATHRQANPWCMAVSMLLDRVSQSTSHDWSSYCARYGDLRRPKRLQMPM